MNHYADIEEGLDTFDDEQERARCEHHFRDNPGLVAFECGEDSDRLFTAHAVQVIHLRGDRKLSTDLRKRETLITSIFDFSEGCVAAEGTVQLGEGELRQHTLEIRWFDFGNERQVTIR